jgi:putative NADH-flavin reductase
MRLFILGATGGIGRHLVRLALERGHFVTAYVRSPKKINEARERLKVMPGDVFNAGEMAGSMEGHDAVLSSFGPNALLSSTLRRDFGRALAAAMRESGVRRLELVSSALLFREAGVFPDILKVTLFRQMLPDMAGMEAEVCHSDLNWTMVRPPRLTNGLARHSYRTTDGSLPKGGFLISRADVAHFMSGEAENPTHVQQIVGIAN